MNSIKKIWLLLMCACYSSPLFAQQSVLRAGDWYKLEINTPGVYKISFDLLKKMGIDPGKINPATLKIYGQGGGMLPQPSNIVRPFDLVENAILVTGEADGKFDKSDYILFYGEGADKVDYDVSRGFFVYEKNLYSDKNYYFLTTGGDAGKRIVPAVNNPGEFPVVQTFDDYAYHESDEYNIDRSGREWFGEKFGLTTDHTMTFNVPGVTPGSAIKIVSDVMGQSYTQASFRLFFNNISFLDQPVSPVPNGRYSVKGIHQRDTVSLAASDVNASGRTSQEVKYEFVKGSGFSQGYLDFIFLQFTRDLSLYGDQTFFLSKESLSNPVSTFRISHITSDAQVWDISHPSDITSEDVDISEEEGRFSIPTTELRKFVVFDNTQQPVFISKINNQNLHGSSTPNLLIITHPDFKEQANRLAIHREGNDNWSVQVVTTDEIYNEFSSGRQDVSALRDFAKLLRDKNPAALRAILLFGKGSYDYKDRLINNTNFVPTYQSRNSLHPLQTYSSDDYFAFLEADEGAWLESPPQPQTLDVGVGRLPVTSVEEATNVVDKIIDYDTNQKTFGSWRKKIVFVADDGNTEDNFTSLHQSQADQLANVIEENNPAFDTRKLFMGSYKKNVQPNGETVPDMAADIKRSFEQGSLIINFTGHGSETVWADERILTDKTIAGLDNDRYPFLVTATCEFGRQDDPSQISSAELAVTRKNAGAIGLVTTARPVNATTNFNLNEAFYESLFEQSENGYATIGEVFQKTKNNSTSGVSNRNFSLIGDPSMVLALPDYSVQITGIKTLTGSDTLKALSTVLAKGYIQGADGVIMDDFNGVLEATLFDKQRQFVTTGKNNPAFVYKQWDNALFRGKASVVDGSFEFTFVMPKNIAYQAGSGKFSFYASDTQSRIDAKGVSTSVIGGSEAGVTPDTTPPEIELFMGDTTFVNGGITMPNTTLIARLSDANGINISGYGIGNSILAQLDDDGQTFVLNDYYVSEVDAYQKGSILFPMHDLTPGKHSLTVKVWDVYNNPSQATIDFVVTDGEALVIESFGNYPNPFENSTLFYFTHNRSGDDLEAQLFIYSLAGELIKSAEISITGSEYRINLMELNTLEDSGKKLAPGLYLARLIVRSIGNGSKNERVTRLIVLN